MASCVASYAFGARSLQILRLGILRLDVNRNDTLACSYSTKRTGEHRHPDFPKKPLTAYLRYCSANYNEFKQNNPGMKPQPLISLIASKYKQLSAEEKQKYINEFNKEHESWKEKVQDFKVGLTPQQKEEIEELKIATALEKDKKLKRRKRQMNKLMNKPKPMNSFAAFIKERMSGQKLSVSELTQEAMKDWRNMSDNEKQRYVEISKKKMEDYTIEIQIWEEKMLELGHNDLVRSSTRKQSEREKIKEMKKEDESVKLPRTAYAFFVKKQTGKVPREDLHDVWKSMSSIEKQPYVQAANRDMNRYSRKLKAWDQRKQEDNEDLS